MTFLFALFAAAAYGAADFLGGLASRRASIFAVIVVSQGLALLLAVAVSPWFPGTPELEDIGWGALAGAAYAVGILLLYLGLARGTMSVVAPITGVSALSLPVAFGLFTGERPSPFALLGIGLSVVAIVLTSRSQAPQSAPSPSEGPSPGSGARSIVAIALGAGLGMGLFFIFLSRAGKDAGFLPLCATRLVAVVGYLGVALGARHPLGLSGSSLRLSLSGGLLDVTANALYFLSLREGLLSLSATLTSLYPATTVLLARLFLREKIGPLQKLGLSLAAAAAVLIAQGA